MSAVFNNTPEYLELTESVVISDLVDEVPLTLDQVESIIKSKKTFIYSQIKKGNMPKQKYYGENGKRPRWWLSQINYYILNQCWDEEEWRKTRPYLNSENQAA